LKCRELPAHRDNPATNYIASGVPRQKVAIIYDVGVSTLYKMFPVGDK
ncbi:helix-turn-helix domain-containing protein, partial [Escherichia coli]